METVHDLSNLSDLDWIRLSGYPGLVVELMSPVVSDADIAVLARLENLEGLHLRAVNLPQLKPLAQLPILSDLSIECPIDDAGLQWLCRQFPELQQLKLQSKFDHQHRLTNDGVQALEQLQHLQRLCLSGVPLLEDAGLQSLLQLKLTHLTIDHSQISGESLMTCAEPLSLRGLSFYDCPVTDSGLASLADCLHKTSLHSLAISIAQLTDKSLATITEFQQLRELHLTQNAIEGTRWNNLQQLGDLQRLYLDSNPLKIKFWSEFPPIPKLTYINLEATPLDIDCLIQLNNQPQLTRIDAGSISFRDSQRFESESDIELDCYSP